MSATLNALVRASLQAGHWRVACRRYLMLVVSGGLVDTQLRGQCESLLDRLSSAELERMEAAAVDWARFVAVAPAAPVARDYAGGGGGDADAAAAHPVPRSLPPLDAMGATLRPFDDGLQEKPHTEWRFVISWPRRQPNWSKPGRRGSAPRSRRPAT